jgi:AcrR family transcriptional regulator
MRAEEKVETDSLVEPPTPRLSVKERQWRLREDAILDAATELLNSKGFNAMTLEDITEAIGISRPTLYLHFKSKEDVVTHTVIRTLCDLREVIATLDPTASPGERLRSFIHSVMEMRFDKNRCAMYDMTRIRLTHASDLPELRDAEREFSNAIIEMTRAAQASGEIPNRMKPEMLVLVLSGFVKNLEIESWIEEGKTTPQEITDAALKLLFD